MSVVPAMTGVDSMPRRLMEVSVPAVVIATSHALKAISYGSVLQCGRIEVIRKQSCRSQPPGCRPYHPSCPLPLFSRERLSSCLRSIGIVILALVSGVALGFAQMGAGILAGALISSG